MTIQTIMAERDRNWKKVKQGLKSIVIDYAAWCFAIDGQWEPKEYVLDECRKYLNEHYPEWYEESGIFGYERYQKMHNRFVAEGTIKAAAEYRRTAKAMEDSYIEELIADFEADADEQVGNLARDYATESAMESLGDA